MKKLLALLLVLAMAFSVMTFLTACDSEDYDDGDTSGEDDKAELYGTWKGTVDLAAMVNESLKAKLGSEALEYLAVEKLDVVMLLEFDKDGEYAVGFDADALETALKGQLPVWVEGFEKAMEDQGKSPADFEAEFGMSVREYLEENLLKGMEIPDTKGEFELDGTKLYLDGDENYMKIKVTEKTLKFTSYSGEDSEVFELLKDGSFKRQ